LVQNEKAQPHSYIRRTALQGPFAHFRFLSKLKDLECALWSEKYVTKVQTTQYLSMLALVSQYHEVHLDLKKVLLMSSTVPITHSSWQQQMNLTSFYNSCSGGSVNH